ncbi:Eukaryotic translation initiation factor 4E [Trichinella pseudospiralis]
MSDFMEEVTEASDDAVASEGGCSPSSYVGELSTNIWTLWRRDMSIDFVGDWLKEMELLDVVETWSDFLKVMVNLTAPLAKSMKPLQYFYFKNSVMPTFEDSENFNGIYEEEKCLSCAFATLNGYYVVISWLCSHLSNQNEIVSALDCACYLPKKREKKIVSKKAVYQVKCSKNYFDASATLLVL